MVTQFALPPLKLPVGYYRDVFINAVYASLSLSALSSSFSIPLLPSPPNLSFLSFFSLLSLSLLPFISLLSFCRKPRYFVNSVTRRALICKSHSPELIPNLARCPKWAPLKQLPI